MIANGLFDIEWWCCCLFSTAYRFRNFLRQQFNKCIYKKNGKSCYILTHWWCEQPRTTIVTASKQIFFIRKRWIWMTFYVNVYQNGKRLEWWWCWWYWQKQQQVAAAAVATTTNVITTINWWFVQWKFHGVNKIHTNSQRASKRERERERLTSTRFVFVVHISLCIGPTIGFFDFPFQVFVLFSFLSIFVWLFHSFRLLFWFIVKWFRSVCKASD